MKITKMEGQDKQNEVETENLKTCKNKYIVKIER